MEQNFQTSFIPKKPIVKDSYVSAQPVGLLMVISLFVIFFVAITTGALFFYKGIVNKNRTQMEQALALAKNRFEPAKISELQVLDRRLRASQDILSKHIAVTPVFEALEAITLKSVRYTNFSYDVSSENNLINIKMSGQAIGYRSIALQSDLFVKNKNLIDPVFSNLTLDNSGNVLFELTFSVDPSLVNYKHMLLSKQN